MMIVIFLNIAMTNLVGNCFIDRIEEVDLVVSKTRGPSFISCFLPCHCLSQFEILTEKVKFFAWLNL